MSPSLPALGIDVGGGSAKIGLVSPSGEVLAQDVVASDPGVSAPVLIDRYLATAERLKKTLAITGISGIGIGIPGHIDFELGTTRLGNVSSLDEFPIVEYVRKQSGARVFLENDATLAALAEHRSGVGQGSDRFLTVVRWVPVLGCRKTLLRSLRGSMLKWHLTLATNILCSKPLKLV